MTDTLKPTQADREAAADFVAWLNKVSSEWEMVNGGTMQFFTSSFPDAIRAGTWDEHPAVQHFARHRLSSDGEREALIEALEPSGATKAAYQLEFSFALYEGVNDDGNDQYRNVYVPWDTVKQIMAAIRTRALSRNNGNG